MRTALLAIATLFIGGCGSLETSLPQVEPPPAHERFVWATNLGEGLREKNVSLEALRGFLHQRSPETQWAFDESGWILASGPQHLEASAVTAVSDLELLFEDGSTAGPQLVAIARCVRTRKTFLYRAEPTAVARRMGHSLDREGFSAFLREFGSRELEFWVSEFAFAQLATGPSAVVEPIVDTGDAQALLRCFESTEDPYAPRNLLRNRALGLSQDQLTVQLYRAGIPTYRGCFGLYIDLPDLTHGGFDAILADEWSDSVPLPTHRDAFLRESSASTRVSSWSRDGSSGRAGLH